MSVETLPATWASVEIEDVLLPYPNGKKIRQGWSPQCEDHPAESHDDWAVLRTSAIQDGAFVDTENKKLPHSLKPRTQLEVLAGDILMTCAGPRARCGITCLVRSTRPRLLISGKMYQLRADPEIAERHFLELFLRESRTKKKIDVMKTGISDSGLNLTHDRFRTLTIPLPPLPEQKRIVAKIEELFSELEAGEESLLVARRQLGIYRQSLLKQAFEGNLTAKWRTQNPAKLESPAILLARIQSARQSRYEQQIKEWDAAMREWEKSGESDRKPPRPTLSPSSKVTSGDFSIPDSWAWTNLGNLKLFSLYGPRFSSDDYTETGVCVLRTSDIGESGKVNLGTAPRLKLSRTELYKYRCDKGDLLITRTGSLGTLAVFNDDVDSIPGAYLIHYRLASAGYATYLYHFLKGPVGQAALTGGGAGIGRPNLNAPTIEAIPIPFCSLPEQQQIVRLLDEQFEVIERNERQIDSALRSSEALCQAILKKAFTGRLVPQDPADEPASKLFARLRAERIIDSKSGGRVRKPSAAL